MWKVYTSMKHLIVIFGYYASFTHATVLNITLAAQLNRDFILPCMLPIGDGVTETEVRWFSDKDGWLTSGTRVYKHQGKISVMKPAPNEWNLRIIKVPLSMEDTYTCKTGGGSLISSIKLVIETSPKIDVTGSSPKGVTVQENETVELTCAVSGTPEPEITWYRGNSEKAIGVRGHMLRIPDIKRYAADDYICRAKNKIGEAEKRISVTVNFPPEVNVMEPEVYAAGGELAVMSCVVQGSPLVDAYWTRGTSPDGEKLQTDWKYNVTVEEAGDGIPVKFLNLVIRKSILTSNYYGKFTCVAKSLNHVVQDTLELKELKKDIEVKPDDQEGKVIKYD